MTVTARVESEAEAGVAAARPDPQTVRAGVAQALEQAAVLGLAPAVRLELDETEEAPALAVTLPAAELRPLAETEDARLVVAALAAEVTLDGTALRTALEGARESLVLTMAPAEAHTLTEAQRQAAGEHAVFSLTLHRDGVEVTDFGGGSARVSLPHTLAEGRREEEVAVWHLDEEGGADPRDCVYEEGRVTFTTPHFSHYAVGYWPAEEPLILETQPPAAAPAGLVRRAKTNAARPPGGSGCRAAFVPYQPIEGESFSRSKGVS